ncbi:hypothetical protein IJG72_03380 [bacterium]|nr:hypothetical protein [bacterium]
MIYSVIILLISILIFGLLLYGKFNLKTYLLCTGILTIAFTIFVCVKTPKMHNPLEIKIINYLIEFRNIDNSMIETTSTNHTKQGDIDK